MLALRSFLYNIVFYLVTIAFVVLGSWLLACPRGWAMAGLRLHGQTCVWLLRLIVGTRLEVRGHEKLPAGPVLVACKHQSAWDTFGLVPLFKDPAIVMKAELGLIPFYGWFSHKFEHVFVRRERGPVALRHLIEDAKARAVQGREIVVFPEGTRRAPGAAPDYKPGVVALYEGLGLTCVPVALNSGLFWPRRKLMRYPGTIVVELLDPLPAGLPRKEFRARLIKTIEEATARLVAEALAKPDAPPRPAADPSHTTSPAADAGR
jgi:1-acyl-sn-glycerol-3-phosphate acyltransferase